LSAVPAVTETHLAAGGGAATDSLTVCLLLLLQEPTYRSVVVLYRAAASTPPPPPSSAGTAATAALQIGVGDWLAAAQSAAEARAAAAVAADTKAAAAAVASEAKAVASTAMRVARRSLTPHAAAAAAAREARKSMRMQENPHNLIIKSFADVAVADLELVRGWWRLIWSRCTLALLQWMILPSTCSRAMSSPQVQLVMLAVNKPHIHRVKSQDPFHVLMLLHFCITFR
jgi:hypothetical protein